MKSPLGKNIKKTDNNKITKTNSKEKADKNDKEIIITTNDIVEEKFKGLEKIIDGITLMSNELLLCCEFILLFLDKRK